MKKINRLCHRCCSLYKDYENWPSVCNIVLLYGLPATGGRRLVLSFLFFMFFKTFCMNTISCLFFIYLFQNKIYLSFSREENIMIKTKSVWFDLFSCIHMLNFNVEDIKLNIFDFDVFLISTFRWKRQSFCYKLLINILHARLSDSYADLWLTFNLPCFKMFLLQQNPAYKDTPWR